MGLVEGPVLDRLLEGRSRFSKPACYRQTAALETPSIGQLSSCLLQTGEYLIEAILIPDRGHRNDSPDL